MRASIRGSGRPPETPGATCARNPSGNRPAIPPPWLPGHASRRLPAVALLVAAVSLATAIAPSQALGAEAWTWPVEGEVITPYRYGGDPFAAGQHRGIDIAAPVGEAVRAATAGTVTFAGTAGDSGLTVAVRTADGRFDTSYLHLDALGVSEGEDVPEGAELGTAGTTGSRSAVAPHVHFGVRASGDDHAYRDPMRFLAAPGGPAPPLGPVAAPRVGPRPLPGPSPARTQRHAPSPSPARTPRYVPSPGGAPVATPTSGPELLPLPPRAAALPGGAARATPDAPSGGFDLGWALACGGLAIAAGALMRPRRTRRRRATLRADGRSARPTAEPVGPPAVR